METYRNLFFLVFLFSLYVIAQWFPMCNWTSDLNHTSHTAGTTTVTVEHLSSSLYVCLVCTYRLYS